MAEFDVVAFLREFIEFLTLIGSFLIIYYNIVKWVQETLNYQFFFLNDDYSRLQRIMIGKQQKKKYNFIFALIIILISMTISILTTLFLGNFIESVNNLIYIPIIFFIMIIFYIIIEYFYITKIKQKKTLQVKIEDDYWYFVDKIDKDRYLFKNANSIKLSKLMILSEDEMINSFCGFVKVPSNMVAKNLDELSKYISIPPESKNN